VLNLRSFRVRVRGPPGPDSKSLWKSLTLYAVNKEVQFVPHEDSWLQLKETSVTDNHWSVRGEKK